MAPPPPPPSLRVFLFLRVLPSVWGGSGWAARRRDAAEEMCKSVYIPAPIRQVSSRTAAASHSPPPARRRPLRRHMIRCEPTHRAVVCHADYVAGDFFSRNFPLVTLPPTSAAAARMSRPRRTTPQGLFGSCVSITKSSRHFR